MKNKRDHINECNIEVIYKYKGGELWIMEI